MGQGGGVGGSERRSVWEEGGNAGVGAKLNNKSA